MFLEGLAPLSRAEEPRPGFLPHGVGEMLEGEARKRRGPAGAAGRRRGTGGWGVSVGPVDGAYPWVAALPSGPHRAGPGPARLPHCRGGGKDPRPFTLVWAGVGKTYMRVHPFGVPLLVLTPQGGVPQAGSGAGGERGASTHL